MPNPYDHAHQKRRRELLPAAYNTPCPRCGEPMLKGQALDLGHSVDRSIDPNALGDRIEHESCNRSAGALLGQDRARFAPTRKWFAE